MNRYAIKHRSGWLACLTWSPERSAKWLAEFDPTMYVDKTLRREDFYVVDQLTGFECP